MSSESSAGEDGIDSTRALDQLVSAMRMVFKDRCEMMKLASFDDGAGCNC